MYISYRRLFYFLFVFISFLGILSLLCKNYESFIVNDLSKALIRFHVRANSDSVADQQLKMKVREKIIEYLDDNLSSAKSSEDAAAFLESNTNEIALLSKKVINSYGYDYPVTATLGKSEFPDRYYGDVKLPSGTYNSFIIEIGSGKGKNWWCVLYPPLCFVDASTGVLPEESKETLKEAISPTEYDYVTGTGSRLSSQQSPYSSEENGNEIQFEFKYFTFLNKLFD